MGNALLFLVSFFFARVVMVPYLYYRYSVYSGISIWAVPGQIPVHCNVASMAFLLLQCYWFSLILKHFVALLSRLLLKASSHGAKTSMINISKNMKEKEK